MSLGVFCHVIVSGFYKGRYSIWVKHSFVKLAFVKKLNVKQTIVHTGRQMYAEGMGRMAREIHPHYHSKK